MHEPELGWPRLPARPRCAPAARAGPWAPFLCFEGDPLERSRRRLAYLDEALKRTLEIQHGKLPDQALLEKIVQNMPGASRPGEGPPTAEELQDILDRALKPEGSVH